MRFQRSLWALLFALVAIMPCQPSRADAQIEQQKKWCAGKDSATPDLRISGCTAVIQSGQLPSKQLAVTFQTRGTVYFYKGDFDRALQDYGQAIKLDPHNSEIFDNRCWTLATTNKPEEALKDCTESLRLRPNFAATLDTLGFVYLKLGRFDQAIATYNAVLKIDPKSVYSLYGKGIAELKTGNTAAGQADIAASKAIKDVADEMAGYGVK